jgi:hypothetical protein
VGRVVSSAAHQGGGAPAVRSARADGLELLVELGVAPDRATGRFLAVGDPADERHEQQAQDDARDHGERPGGREAVHDDRRGHEQHEIGLRDVEFTRRDQRGQGQHDAGHGDRGPDDGAQRGLFEVVDVEHDAVGEVVELDAGEDHRDQEQRDRPAARDAHEVRDELFRAVHQYRDAQHELDDGDHGGLLRRARSR